ncbi:MAG: hypothetical protein SO369_04185 [Treponema sp.]|nr:hypothetical protein [Treponema sp.]
MSSSDFTQELVQDESSIEAYYTATNQFLSALKSYQNALSISYAIKQDVYTNDILRGLFSALEDSLFILEQEISPEAETEVHQKLFVKYSLIQKEMIGFFHLLNESARVSGFIITIMLCSLSIIIFSGLVFVLNYIKRRNQVIQLEKKVQEQHLVVKVQETERIKLGAELHDTAIQDFKALKLFLMQLESRIQKTSEIDSILVKIYELEKNGLSNLYAILHKLTPPEVDGEDFKSALLSLCGNFKKDSGIDCVFYVDPEAHLNALTGDVRLQVYRVVQEALTNVARHSKATECIISVREENNRIIMFISDDGIGLGERNPSEKSDTGGFGLRGMESRIAIVGGNFRVRWDEDGTEIRLEIPVA